MLKDREEMEKLVMLASVGIGKNPNLVEQIKQRLLQYGILPDRTQRMLNGKLQDENLSVLYLFTKVLYKELDDESINPKLFFTEKEIKIAERYREDEEMNSTKYPIVFNDVLMLDSENYITKLHISDLVKLYESNVLEYNFETQRNPKFQRRKDVIIIVPQLNKQSVNEIAEHLRNNTFYPDTLTLNILGDGTEDFVYDPKTRQLIVKFGQVDILDGFHRLNAMIRVYEENPEIDFTTNLAIKNYTIRKAQQYVAQINTVNKIDKAHLQALKADRYSDFVVKELQRDSDLRGKIVQSSRLTSLNQGWVSYNVLADTIEEAFPMENKKEAMEVAEYLTKYFDFLVGTYPNLGDITNINGNLMFIGLVIIAKKIREEGLPIGELTKIIDKVSFAKTNPLWEELGVLKEGRVQPKAKSLIKKYFEQLGTTYD